ncbi:MAG TPA: CBS domain-containing protein [Aeromicrobium sp.]|jgi:CBS domain-containing protein|nr:CBS domain-containing protein [Aeromicrobium sp.]HKY56539.1 CBS domain-containing protein [Aeromicrobium sp.]
MRVREILSAKSIGEVFTIRPDATVDELLTTLADLNIGALVVSADGSHMEGIVSERDIVRKLRNFDQPASTSVGEIMTSDVRVCGPDDTLDELMGVMTEHRVRHVPVLDGDVLVGLLSIGDAVKSRMDQLEFERDQLTHYLHGQ